MPTPEGHDPQRDHQCEVQNSKKYSRATPLRSSFLLGRRQTRRQVRFRAGRRVGRPPDEIRASHAERGKSRSGGGLDIGSRRSENRRAAPSSERLRQPRPRFPRGVPKPPKCFFATTPSRGPLCAFGVIAQGVWPSCQSRLLLVGHTPSLVGAILGGDVGGERGDRAPRLRFLAPTPTLAASAGLVHPDVVIDLSRNVFNPGIHRGLDGFPTFPRTGRRDVAELSDHSREEFLDAGDNVFVAYRISGKGRGSGIETEMRLFSVWTLRGGRVSLFKG